MRLQITFVVSHFPVENAILAVCLRGHTSSCSVFLDSYSSWKVVAFSSKRCYALNASNYLWPLCFLFLKDINEENLSLSNQSPEFRSTDNLGMQSSRQCFHEGLLLNQFCILTFSLSGVFCLFWILAKSSLCFAALGSVTVILVLDACLKQMGLTCGRQRVKITLQWIFRP